MPATAAIEPTLKHQANMSQMSNISLMTDFVKEN
jgi:hypothetical protein